MSGFLGMAVYGMRAGRAWSDDEDEEDMEVDGGESERGDKDEEKKETTSSTTASRSASRGRSTRSVHTTPGGSPGASSSSAASLNGNEVREGPTETAAESAEETRAIGEHDGNED